MLLLITSAARKDRGRTGLPHRPNRGPILMVQGPLAAFTNLTRNEPYSISSAYETQGGQNHPATIACGANATHCSAHSSI
jgi:hypothetical protein